jgi:short-subunit dehydrogenase
MNLETKRVALITGASSGLGKDFALRLLSKGYVVYGAARRIERMHDIEAAGGVALEMDVTDDATMVSAVNRIIGDQNRIDVLINNAGYGQMGALEDVPIDEGRRQMEVNLIGAARLTQLALPSMRAQKFGKIVNISSMGGKISTPFAGWYHASKFALEGYSDALRMEVQPFGIDVIVIEPGGTDTEWIPIALAEAQRYSGQGAYGQFVSAMLKSATWQRKMPPPRIITDLLVKAIESKRPRTRYHGGATAGLTLFLKRFLPDRLFDRLMMKAMQ